MSNDLGKTEFLTVHERWLKKINRDIDAENKPDKWIWNQCETCRHYLRLAGEYGNDWGVCSNLISKFDGQSRFSHDGCDFFEE